MENMAVDFDKVDQNAFVKKHRKKLHDPEMSEDFGKKKTFTEVSFIQKYSTLIVR